MPIRTHRGRAAVYRRLWGWPLRSPKHLVVAVIVIAGAATVIGFLLPEPAPPARPRSAGQTVTESEAQAPPSTTTSAAPPTISVPNAPPPDAPPDPAGLAVVEAWGKAWTNHPAGTTKQQWLDGLRPHTAPEFLPEMRTVALANVPTALTGPPQPVNSTAKTITVRLPTNLGPIQIMVANTQQGWRITHYDKAV